MLQRRRALDAAEAANMTRYNFATERAGIASMERFFAVPAGVQRDASVLLTSLEQSAGPVAAQPAPSTGRLVYRRNPNVKGPLSAMGSDYLAEKAGAARAGSLRLPGYRGLYGTGDLYAYEALNFVDGKRTVNDIRDALSAQFGPVPLDLVVEYLAVLESSGLLQRVGISSD
jgi:hypothetical protein